MSWYLNPFLTSFRAKVNATFPLRTRGSDGTIGDAAHQATDSQHNIDTDGSVDAWDCDVNLLGSSTPTGSAGEIRAMWDLIAVFQAQPQAQLWIFRGQIANRDVGNWKVRAYNGPSPHDHHCHFQSRQAREDQTFTGDLVLPATNRTGDDMTKAELIAFLKTDEAKLLLGRAVWEHDIGSATGGNGQRAQSTLVTANTRAGYLANPFAAAVLASLDALGQPGGPLTDEQIETLSTKIANGIPDSLTESILNKLRDRLAA